LASWRRDVDARNKKIKLFSYFTRLICIPDVCFNGFLG
jgi:hypothetical protein